MALASLVSFQKQKLTVIKIFMKLDIEKAVFQRGNKRTFFMPLVDTRSLIQYKTNIITYGKNMTQYWHMQMHPDDQSFSEVLHSILENKKIIGLGKWAGGQVEKEDFFNRMKVNDIVAIKNGGKLIALVQVIGGAYEVNDDESETDWIVFRRPIRVLDWDIWGKTLPQPRKTLVICSSENAETTKIIKEWHEKVNEVLTKEVYHSLFNSTGKLRKASL